MNVNMNTMNIEATKLELMHLLLQTQEESLLTRLKKVFEDERVDWWDNLSVEEQKGIDIGLSQADKGQYISDEEAMNRFKKWH